MTKREPVIMVHHAGGGCASRSMAVEDEGLVALQLVAFLEGHSGLLPDGQLSDGGWARHRAVLLAQALQPERARRINGRRSGDDAGTRAPPDLAGMHLC
jgi:hypothetical protein